MFLSRADIRTIVTGQSPTELLLRLFSLGCGVALLWAVTGCGSGSTAVPSAGAAGSPPSSATGTGTSVGTGVHGRAQSGPQPVVGAHIYFFAANTAGYGAASVSLINPALPGTAVDALGSYVLTNAQGGFGIGGVYTCTPGQLVYALAQGGSTGDAPPNTASALLTILGTCPAEGNFDQSQPFININQVSTVVTAYALAGFITDGAHVSATATSNAHTGLANAFAVVSNLMDVTAGQAYSQTPESSGVVPQAEINTLANVILPCIQDSSACASLFALTPDAAGNAPRDTVSTILNVVRNPGANAAALFTLAANHTFLPALSAPPNDWTLAVTYFAPNLAGAYFPAVDAAGNLWVPGFANNTLTEFDPTGNLLSGDTGFSGGGLAQPFSVAVDANGNTWVSNFGGSSGAPSVSEFAANGSAITSNGFACGASCSFLAIDAQENLWVSGSPQVTTIKSSGVALSAFSTNGFSAGVAVDSQGRGWTIGSGRALARLTLPAAVVTYPESVTAAAGHDLTAVAIDSADHIWFASTQEGALGKHANDGSPISPPGGFKGGGLQTSAGIAVDGSDQVWIANRNGNSISAFSSAGVALSPAAGYIAAGVSNPRGIALDPSGNVWITNFTGNSVTEFVGAATPTATPMTPANHGQRP